MKTNRERALSFFYPGFIFAVNLFITWRYMRSGYIDQLQSIEGAFVSLARYIQQHWPAYDWMGIWYGGFPFTHAYQPALHYTVAVFGAVFGLSAPSAYHFITAVTYSLAGVGFYLLAQVVGASRRVAAGGALVYSVFSPSLLLLSPVRADAGGLWHARRLQALAHYGEGPNITGLALGLFALALLYRALRGRCASSAITAAAALALIPATNWPSSVALAFGVIALLVGFSAREIVEFAGRLCAIAALACCFALPFALPSSVLATFHNANVMSDAPTAGALRWGLLVLIAALVAVIRWTQGRFGVSYGVRFASAYLVLLCAVVLCAANAHVNLVPQPMRFHVAMEIPMILTGTFLIQAVLRRWPRLGVPVGAAVLIFCAVQTYNFRRHSKEMSVPLDITKTLEFQEARWFQQNMPGQKVAVPGTVSFWLNAFGDTPQLTGCCEQSVVNPENFISAYIVGAGYQSDAESADYSLLWLKAQGVQAVGIGGPASREGYKAYQYPERFKDRLPLLWQNGDDFIYRIPQHAPGLARVVRSGDVVRHPPANGVDVAELRRFVNALDDPALPVASFEWQGPNVARISAQMVPGQVLNVAVNFAPGWTASVGGKPTELRADGMGLITISPGCSGPCTVEMRWSAGWEPWIAWLAALLAVAASLFWWKNDRWKNDRWKNDRRQPA